MATIDNLSELRKAVQDSFAGKHDLKLAAESCERMDREREEARKRIGEVNLAVELIREARNEV